MASTRSGPGRTRSSQGVEMIPARRFFAALEHKDTAVKKRAIVGLIVRTELAGKYGVPLVSYSEPGEESSLFSAVYALFGGKAGFDKKIQHPSWQQIITDKREEMLVELDLPFYKTRQTELMVGGGVLFLVLLFLVFWPASEKGSSTRVVKSAPQAGQ